MLTIFLFIGLVSLQMLPETSPVSIHIGQFRVFPGLYSISLVNNQNLQDFYKISPYDDIIYYEDGTWDKVIRGDEQILNEFINKASFWDKKVVWPLQRLLRKPQVKFVTSSKNLTYQVFDAENKVIIQRSILKLPKKAVAFSQTFSFSKNDEIIDSNNKIYTIENLPSDRIEITSIEYLSFKNSKNSNLIIFPVKPDQNVIIDKNYRLLEVKEDLESPTINIKIQQVLYLR